MDKLDSSITKKPANAYRRASYSISMHRWKAGQIRRASTYNSFERTQTEQAQRQQLDATVKSSVEQEAGGI